MTAPTFITVSGGDKKLGDYTPVSKGGAGFTASNFSLNLYDAKTKAAKIGEDEWIMANYATEIGKIKAANLAVSFVWMAPKGGTPAWYLAADTRGFTAPMKDYPLKDGQGFIMTVGSDHGEGVTLNYAGQVDNENTEIIVKNASLIVANIQPVDRTLGDFTPTSLGGAGFTASNFTLNLYDAKTKAAKIGEDDWIMANYATEIGKIKAANLPVSFVWMAPKGGTPAWYLAADTRGFTAPMKDYPIKAGQGFMMTVGSDHGTGENQGVQLTIPSALE